MPGPTAITTNQLTRTFGDDIAVDHVNLRVPRGSVYGFLGPNGAGKSTTIRMLLGLISPDQGSVHLLGKPLNNHRVSLLQKIGALVEFPSLYDHLTGRENLTLTAYLRGGISESAVQSTLETVGLRDAADQRVRTYSTGMRQRLGIATSLLGDPDLLVLDEPTYGLDPAGMHEIRELIRSLPARSDVTVFLSSHLLNEVERIATHVGIIRGGTLLYQGAAEQLEAAHRSRVTIETNQPDQARLVLEQDGVDLTSTDGNRLFISPGDEETASQCVRLLVDAGLDVYHVSLEEASLEDIFLDLTESGSA